jgi:hypothetical protein
MSERSELQRQGKAPFSRPPRNEAVVRERSELQRQGKAPFSRPPRNEAVG